MTDARRIRAHVVMYLKPGVPRSIHKGDVIYASDMLEAVVLEVNEDTGRPVDKEEAAGFGIAYCPSPDQLGYKEDKQ